MSIHSGKRRAQEVEPHNYGNYPRILIFVSRVFFLGTLAEAAAFFNTNIPWLYLWIIEKFDKKLRKRI